MSVPDVGTDMDDSLLFPEIPRPDFERSVGELITRAHGVLTAESRLRSRLAAYRSITENLDLDLVLRRIVEAAATLARARYCALGVLGEDGRLERFIHVGMDPSVVEEIGHLPIGHGLLGAVIDSAETIRLSHLGDDPRSVGLPKHHPPMDAFLGVPVRAHDEIYGNLYLTNPESGEFTEEDTELIESLAATAGIAIDKRTALRDGTSPATAGGRHLGGERCPAGTGERGRTGGGSRACPFRPQRRSDHDRRAGAQR